MSLRLIQLRSADGVRTVAAIDDDGDARLINGIKSTYDLALSAIDRAVIPASLSVMTSAASVTSIASVP